MAHINKKLLFLSLLFTTAATRCMETNNAKFTLNSLDNRHKLMSKLTGACPAIIYPYYHENHRLALGNNYSDVKACQGVAINGYSMLAFAAIAIKVYPSRDNQMNSPTTYPEYAPYADRKNLIKALLSDGWKPTKKDRELALIIEREERIITFGGKSDLLDQL